MGNKSGSSIRKTGLCVWRSKIEVAWLGIIGRHERKKSKTLGLKKHGINT
jgi:hypothetical protein